jgi:hypothetical protein
VDHLVRTVNALTFGVRSQSSRFLEQSHELPSEEPLSTAEQHLVDAANRREFAHTFGHRSEDEGGAENVEFPSTLKSLISEEQFEHQRLTKPPVTLQGTRDDQSGSSEDTSVPRQILEPFQTLTRKRVDSQSKRRLVTVSVTRDVYELTQPHVTSRRSTLLLMNAHTGIPV